MLTPAVEKTARGRRAHAVLQLTVRNHPGVLSHVCGLFARRAFNVEGVLCMPVGDGARSRVWLLVAEDERLEQMIRQLGKLEDVVEVRRHGAQHPVFLQLEVFFQERDERSPQSRETQGPLGHRPAGRR